MRAYLIKWLDWPQTWAVLALLAIFAVSLLPSLMSFGGFGPGLALAFLALGLWLMITAVWEMRRAATTVNPRAAPTKLVTDSVFALSRNPIYLGDVALLLAATFWADEACALPFVAAFAYLVNARFIPVEEARLVDTFGEEAAAYFNRVRRWI